MFDPGEIVVHFHANKVIYCAALESVIMAGIVDSVVVEIRVKADPFP